MNSSKPHQGQGSENYISCVLDDESKRLTAFNNSNTFDVQENDATLVRMLSENDKGLDEKLRM